MDLNRNHEEHLQKQVFRHNISNLLLHQKEVTLNSAKSKVMYKYQDADFFNCYFQSLKDFNLVKTFVFDKSERQYKGVISPVKSIHKIEIEVEIPPCFPHQKMSFYTTSLHGYPHLIYRRNEERSWFCLNTPFGETPENQLVLELDRLRGWLKRNIRKGLPAKITNKDVIEALRIEDALAWEEQSQELQLYNPHSGLVLFANDELKNIKTSNNCGVLRCKGEKGCDAWFNPITSIGCDYIPIRLCGCFGKYTTNCTDVPFVIVDKIPVRGEKRIDSFVELKNFYKWDDDTIAHLLGDNIPKIGELCVCWECISTEKVDTDRLRKSFESMDLPVAHKDAIRPELERCCKENANGIFGLFDDTINMTAEEEEELNQSSEKQSAYFCFALCVKDVLKNDDINKDLWILYWSSNSKERSIVQKYNYKIGEPKWDVELEEVKDHRFDSQLASIIRYESFFGRGMLSSELTNKKILLLGCGALGSALAETMVRGGVKFLKLWDGDRIEVGNICRSSYTLDYCGYNKANALATQLESISPFVKVMRVNEDFYGNINYYNQKDFIGQIESNDIIIDCTGSNELLHFLSYACADKQLISLCITNHAKDLLLLSNKTDNVFNLRKAYLAQLENDTKNLYAEGTGCYEPTFLASNADVASLVNLAVKFISKGFDDKRWCQSVILSTCDNAGVTENVLHRYHLSSLDIDLVVPNQLLFDIDCIDEPSSKVIGYLFGCYGNDGKSIYVTSAPQAKYACRQLKDVFAQSEGVIDYIGDIAYTNGTPNNDDELMALMESKSNSREINTNNPLLASVDEDGNVDFYLYINGVLQKFEIRK